MCLLRYWRHKSPIKINCCRDIRQLNRITSNRSSTKPMLCAALNSQIMTIFETYLVVNVFLTGTMWDEMKLQEFTIPKAIGFLLSLTFFICFALPVFILDEVVDYCKYKFKGDGINSTNMFYCVERFFVTIKRRLTKRKPTRHSTLRTDCLK